VLARHTVDPSTAAYDFLRPTVASYDTLVSLSEVAAEHLVQASCALLRSEARSADPSCRTTPTKPALNRLQLALLALRLAADGARPRCSPPGRGELSARPPERGELSARPPRRGELSARPPGASCSSPKTTTQRTQPGTDVVGGVGHTAASLPRSRSSPVDVSHGSITLCGLRLGPRSACSPFCTVRSATPRSASRALHGHAAAPRKEQ
jgi:hypothetical protein